MGQRSRFFDSSSGDRIYTSDAFAQVIAGLVSDGVVQVSSELGVTEASPPAMSVLVGLGKAFVQGYMLEVYSAAETLVIGAADGSHARIDRIVVRRDLSARDVVLAVLAGTPSATPTAPALTQTVGGTYEISLAQVLVPAASVSVINSRITDERGLASPPGATVIDDGDVTSAKLADGAVTTSKLGALAVVTTKIATAARRWQFKRIPEQVLANFVNGQTGAQTVTATSVPADAIAVQVIGGIRRVADGQNEALTIMDYDTSRAGLIYTSGNAGVGGFGSAGPVFLGGTGKQFKWKSSDAGADTIVYISVVGYWTEAD